jgi:hypothetical protein
VVGLELSEPLETLLVGESVERASEAIHGCWVAEVRIGKSWSYKMRCMCWNVSSLVIGMDWDIASEALLHLELWEAKHMSEIACPIKIMISRDELRLVIFMSVDGCAN